MYNFLLVFNTSLPSVLYCFRDIGFDRSKIAIFGYPFVSNSPSGGVPLGRSPQKIFVDASCMMAKVGLLNGVETLPKISTALLGCTNVTDRQTDGRQHYSERSLKTRDFTLIVSAVFSGLTSVRDWQSDRQTDRPGYSVRCGVIMRNYVGYGKATYSFHVSTNNFATILVTICAFKTFNQA